MKQQPPEIRVQQYHDFIAKLCSMAGIADAIMENMGVSEVIRREMPGEHDTIN
jgi:hypothetical protein